ncbi:MAG: DUF429 domain-containing protein [Gammaproteobacteria bacterium]|nr:DUF429 domain-containing protein [Gammaproteobacteria bacterium]
MHATSRAPLLGADHPVQAYSGSGFAEFRQVLGCNDYAEACRINQAITGRKLSRQSWNILPRIAEVDTLIQALPDRRKLREMHPELGFMGLNGGVPMAHSKKTQAGHQERLRILQRYRPDAEAICQSLRAAWPKRELANDDIHDALVGAVIASLKDRHRQVPEQPETDTKGLPMEILYAAI